ncbi:protein SMALL AUXIN UP-REGULATED RNA 51-like [Rutidosis leptorrhynchoides]|uniref:protein SMALL AUXIN UP-REGULATED RNA 51-like n=1 Tax=Rutidosis leptorrhynchoides TaxID=125765 RepID=UPI003A98F6AC
MMQVKIVKAWLKKRPFNEFGNGVLAWLNCEKWCSWAFNKKSLYMHEDDEEDNYIPRDVPKGHMVVYVGENQTRFVINVILLKNPLFNALLDQAQEEYDFTADSRRLWGDQSYSNQGCSKED